MSGTLVLVRHGQSEWNLKNLFTGWRDVGLSDQGVEEYFTMIYGTADLTNGIVRLVQAGHPPMFLQRADGSVEVLGDGGMPIGLLPEPEFDCIELRLNPGDRVFLCSDGFTESVDREGVMLDGDGMAAMIEAASPPFMSHAPRP